MKYSKIVLAGGNGYLGSVLINHFKPMADEIIILSRKRYINKENVRTVLWDGRNKGEWIECLHGADLLVNLCGKNVNCRYTERNKTEIIQSRVLPTTLLGNAIESMSAPPKVWINVTSATIYRHAEDHPQDESTGEIGYGFSINVCRKWEESFFASSTPATRKIALRMGIVLGRTDGVFPRLMNLVRAGFGGKQGNGSQMISWVHEQDAARVIEWLIENQLEGIINCTAPGAINNNEFMKILRKSYGIPFGLPMPYWLLELGAMIIGTETELIIKSRWVQPQRLLDGGYKFMFTGASHAIHDILSLSRKSV